MTITNSHCHYRHLPPHHHHHLRHHRHPHHRHRRRHRRRHLNRHRRHHMHPRRHRHRHNRRHMYCHRHDHFHPQRHLHRQRHVSQVFVFTDDKDWASKHLQLPHNTRIVSLPSEFDTPVVNLLALSQGHRFVISNSTFGWWGAWLSDSPGTSVVAPRRWFRDLSRDGSLLVPDSWVTL